MPGFPTANPATPQNQAALELTQMHLQQAVQLAGSSKDLIPALLLALAINKQTLQQKRDA